MGQGFWHGQWGHGCEVSSGWFVVFMEWFFGIGGLAGAVFRGWSLGVAQAAGWQGSGVSRNFG